MQPYKVNHQQVNMRMRFYGIKPHDEEKLIFRTRRKIFDLILEHDHGKVQAAKLPRIHSVRQWVNKILIGKRLHCG